MLSRFKILDDIKQGRVHLYFTRVCSTLLLKYKCQVKVSCQTEQENNVVGECQSIMSDRTRNNVVGECQSIMSDRKKKTMWLESVKVSCQTEKENNVVGECQRIMSDRKRKQCGWRLELSQSPLCIQSGANK